jgi:hypothetical protein
MVLMPGGSADSANCYCHSLWIFGAGGPVNMYIGNEGYRNGELYQRHLENRRGTLEREVYGKKFRL